MNPTKEKTKGVAILWTKSKRQMNVVRAEQSKAENERLRQQVAELQASQKP